VRESLLVIRGLSFPFVAFHFIRFIRFIARDAFQRAAPRDEMKREAARRHPQNPRVHPPAGDVRASPGLFGQRAANLNRPGNSARFAAP
jgi:hypothetical protein